MIFIVALPLALITMGPRKSKSAGGGFGAAKAKAPTYEEVLASFKTRLPRDASEPCVCGDAAWEPSYAACCRPYHQLEKRAESPERLLRTRYAAFRYRLPNYIIETTDKSNRDYMPNKIKWAHKLDKEQMFDTFSFEGLEVGETEAGASEKEAFLDFRVTLQPIDKRTKLKTQAAPMVFAERSRFRKVGDAWLYASGEVTSEEAGLKGAVLNGQRDLTKLEKDVEYVKGVLGEDSPFK